MASLCFFFFKCLFSNLGQIATVHPDCANRVGLCCCYRYIMQFVSFNVPEQLSFTTSSVHVDAEDEIKIIITKSRNKKNLYIVSTHNNKLFLMAMSSFQFFLKLLVTPQSSNCDNCHDVHRMLTLEDYAIPNLAMTANLFGSRQLAKRISRHSCCYSSYVSNLICQNRARFIKSSQRRTKVEMKLNKYFRRCTNLCLLNRPFIETLGIYCTKLRNT